MGNNPRHIPSPDLLSLVSIRCIQARYLLRPSPRLNALIIGVLAKAQQKYGVDVFAPTVLSNHGHYLVRFVDAEQQARFMHFVDGNIAREAGRLHEWRGKFWGEPFAPSLVAPDEPSQLEALRYILSQGCKENLVSRPQDWPGVNAASILLSGRNPKGIWVNRTELYEARRRKRGRNKVRPVDFEDEVELKISQLPCWAHLSPEAYLARIQDLVDEVIEETKTRHEKDGTRPLGRRKVLRFHPHHLPSRAKFSRLPIVRASSRKVRKKYQDAYRIFLSAYRQASAKLLAGVENVSFPAGCFPPGLPFVATRLPP